MIRSSNLKLTFFVVGLLVACSLTCLGCIGDQTGSDAISDENIGNSSISVVDDLGRVITLPEPASNIVSMSPDATILLLVIGAGDTLSGVSGSPLTYSYMVEKMPHAVSVGGEQGSGVAVEKILLLNPDIVILTTRTDTSVMDKLNLAKIPYMVIDGYKLGSVQKEVTQLGILTGKTEGADKYNAFYSRYYDLIKERVGSVPVSERPTVYFEGGRDYSTVGNTSGGDSLMKMACGENIAGNFDVPWPDVSPEWIIQQNPEVFIKIAYPTSLNASSIQDIYNITRNRISISTTRAIQNERTHVINYKITYNTIGIVALTYMAKAFYPEEFADIDPAEVLSEYDREFLPGSKVDNPFYPELPALRG